MASLYKPTITTYQLPDGKHRTPDGKRVTKKRKKFPGYLMAEVEYNDKILYLFRETSGVGDFVGGGLNRPPLPMSAREVERMLGSRGDAPNSSSRRPKPGTTSSRACGRRWIIWIA